MTEVTESLDSSPVITVQMTHWAQLNDENVKLRQQVEALGRDKMQYRNELFNYKQNVGQCLHEYFEELNLSDNELADRDELFRTLDIEDYLPKTEWQVEVKVESTAWIKVDAPSKEAAIELVNDNVSSSEILSNLETWNLTWEAIDAEVD